MFIIICFEFPTKIFIFNGNLFIDWMDFKLEVEIYINFIFERFINDYFLFKIIKKQR